MDELIDKWLGRYHITEKIGKGGMGIVYKAEDTMLDRPVAVKIIQSQYRDSPKFFERFRREALSLARLEHTNIVKLLDFGEQEDIAYLVMPYLNGGSLADRIGEPIPYPIAAELLYPIAQALAHAHQRKIIHRDVKPGNILFDENGLPMITDFGLTKLIAEEGLQPITSVGIGIGTPEYMSPEQGQGQPIDYATDIYSLGVVFYELLTGHKPFEGTSMAEILQQHVYSDPPSPAKTIPNLPEKVNLLVLKALAKNPNDRFTDMEEFAQMLDKLSDEDENYSNQTISVPSTDRFIESSPTRVDQPEEEMQKTRIDPGKTDQPAPVVIPTPPSEKPPRKFPWWVGCLIASALLICCLLGVILVGVGTYLLPDSLRPESLSFLSSATPTRRPTKTAVPTKTANTIEAVIVEPSAAPLATEAPAATMAPTPTLVSVQLVNLEIWTSETGENLAFWQNLIYDFESTNPNITLELVEVPYSEFSARVDTAFAAGIPPDLFLVDPSYLKGYVNSQWFIPANKLVDLSLYEPKLAEVTTIDQVTWGVPVSNYSQIVLFYNKALVSTPPQNTDEFIEVAKASGLSYFHQLWYFDQPWFSGFGGQYFKSSSDIPQLNSDEMVQTLQFISDLTNKYGLLPATTDYSTADTEFISSQTGMIINGIWAYASYQTPLGDNLGVAPLPYVSSTGLRPSSLITGLNFFATNTSMEEYQLNAISKWVSFATNYNNQILMADQLNYLPAQQSTYTDPSVTENPLLSAMLQQLPYGIPEYNSVNWTCIYSATDPEISLLLSQSETPEQAVEKMQEALKACLIYQ